MIHLTRLDGSAFYLNADHIQAIEATPDTHVLLTNGQQYLVREPADEVSEDVIAYKKRIFSIWARA
jgi:flagellar protein FlbD